MVGSGFGGWCARGFCFGLVLSFASKSLAQSTASFPAPPGASTPPAVAPPPPSSPASASRPAPSVTPSASPSPRPTPSAAVTPPPKVAPPAAVPAAAGSATESAALQPTPAVANGFYPALLPYRAGLPIPPGYRVEHRAATGIIVGGLATFGIAYGTALVIAASAKGDGTGWLGVPVIGPWAAIGARSYHCTNDPLLANQCVSGAFSEVQTIAALSADGVIQAAGAVLFVVGLASGHDELVRTDLPVSFRVLPRKVGADGFGFGLDGRF